MAKILFKAVEFGTVVGPVSGSILHFDPKGDPEAQYALIDEGDARKVEEARIAKAATKAETRKWHDDRSGIENLLADVAADNLAESVEHETDVPGVSNAGARDAVMFPSAQNVRGDVEGGLPAPATAQGAAGAPVDGETAGGEGEGDDDAPPATPAPKRKAAAAPAAETKDAGNGG